MWTPRFFLTFPQAMVTQNGTASLMVTRLWDYFPVPTQDELIRQHDGFGPPIKCEVSGEWFPSSRIVQQWDGKKVGDIYVTYGPRPWPF